MALITSLLGAGSGILGTSEQTIGSPGDVTNINAEQTAQMMQLLQGILGQSQTGMDQTGAQANSAFNNLLQQGQQGSANAQQAYGQGLNNAQQGYNSLTSLQGQLANQPGYNTGASTALFQQNVPMYQDLATQAQQQALSGFETPASTQAMLTADRNVSSAANQFANLGGSTSGAAAGAAAQGAQAPLAQLALDRASLGNQAYSNTLNPLLQQGQQLATQESQFDYNSGIQQLMNLIGAAGQQGQLGLGQASAANQAQSNATNQQNIGAQGIAGQSALQAGLFGQALGGLSSLSQPEYFTPAYQPATGLGGLDSIPSELTDILSYGYLPLGLYNTFK